MEYDDYVLTHRLTPCGPIPTALDPNGVYPYVSYCETSRRPVPKKYRFIELENGRLKVTICPDLGGRVTSIVHKKSGREILYAPGIIRPARILPRFCFVPGGIEVSFPISHSPTQNESVLYRIDRTESRTYVTCGERELRLGMQWSVEYSLGLQDEFLTERVLFHNPGTAAWPWMSWSNAALPSAPDTEYHFPRGEVLVHASQMVSIDWEKQGPKRESDIQEMTGYFWKSPDVNAFGAYTPSLGTGLYHIADPALAPGMKLWSYGIGHDRAWATLGGPTLQSYIEIQGGPVKDQSIKLELRPGETRWHVEHWLPTDKPLNIYSLKMPKSSDLRHISEIPLFGWARTDEVRVWNELLSAYQHSVSSGTSVEYGSGSAWSLPDPPEIDRNCWAPSGMENLGPAFTWAIGNASNASADLWKFHHGTWLAGRGETEDAIRILAGCNTGMAKALLCRLFRARGDIREAAAVIETIQEPWLQLHPQIVVERDKALRNLGKQTLAEREKWLNKVNALEDESIVERRVQVLIDRGDFEAAQELLLSISFQKVHQTYNRTDLWMQICEKLSRPRDPIPQSLGEDALARFGAYREFD